MDRLEDLENIIDTLSVLIDEVKTIDLKDFLLEEKKTFMGEKEDLEIEYQEKMNNYDLENEIAWQNMKL